MADNTMLESHEISALQMYVVLARDIGDFVEMLPDKSEETIQTLYLILALPNPKHNSDTKELNEFGAELVKKHAEKRKISLTEQEGLIKEKCRPR